MPIISNETWDKFTQEEKDKIRKKYRYFNKVAYHGAMKSFETIFPEEALQPKPLTYEDVARELFEGKEFFIYDSENDVIVPELRPLNKPINCTSKKQAEKLLAINRLLNVARFLNGKDWKPDWSDENERKWFIRVEENGDCSLDFTYDENYTFVYFRTEELARQAIQILGEDTVRLALTTEY